MDRVAQEEDIWEYEGIYYHVIKGHHPYFAPSDATELWAEGYLGMIIWDIHWLEDNCEYVGNHYD